MRESERKITVLFTAGVKNGQLLSRKYCMFEICQGPRFRDSSISVAMLDGSVRWTVSRLINGSNFCVGKY